MELEVGMYVRTDKGIIKYFPNDKHHVMKYEANINCVHLYDNDYGEWDDYYKVIGTPSHNIIDLIEVGDYVNGSTVLEIKDNKIYVDTIDGAEITDLEVEEYCQICNYNLLPTYWKDTQIKSIVTKESFESVSYKLGKEDN